MSAFDEIVGSDLVHADPAAIRAAGTTLSTLSETAAALRTRLTGTDAGTWTGSAAEAFESVQQGEIPTELSKLGQSFEQAAGALSAYARVVEATLASGRTLASQLDQARANERAAAERKTGAEQGARNSVHAANTSTDPTQHGALQAAVGRARQALASATNQHCAASGEVARLLEQGKRLREHHDADARTASQRLDDASQPSIHERLTALREHTTHELAQAAVPILDFIQKYSDYIAIAATVIGVIAFIIATVLTGGAFAVAAAGIAGTVAAWAGTTALVAGIAGAAAGTAKFELEGLDPFDDRSPEEIASEGGEVLLGIVAVIPGLRGLKYAKDVKYAKDAKDVEAVKKLSLLSPRESIEKWVSAAGRENPPRKYMTRARKLESELIDKGRDATFEVVSHANNFVTDKFAAERAQSDAENLRRKPSSTPPTYRGSYRYDPSLLFA